MELKLSPQSLAKSKTLQDNIKLLVPVVVKIDFKVSDIAFITYQIDKPINVNDEAFKEAVLSLAAASNGQVNKKTF